MTPWIVVLAAGLGTYLFRLSMIVAADRVRMPEQLDRGAELVAPAAFTALAMTSVATATVSTGMSQALPLLCAVTVAVLAVLRTRSSHAAVLAGMPTFWLLTALIPA